MIHTEYSVGTATVVAIIVQRAPPAALVLQRRQRQCISREAQGLLPDRDLASSSVQKTRMMYQRYSSSCIAERCLVRYSRASFSGKEAKKVFMLEATNWSKHTSRMLAVRAQVVGLHYSNRLHWFVSQHVNYFFFSFFHPCFFFSGGFSSPFFFFFLFRAYDT